MSKKPDNRKSLQEYALEYHRLGWCIIPIPYGKKAARIKWDVAFAILLSPAIANHQGLGSFSFAKAVNRAPIGRREDLAIAYGQAVHGSFERSFPQHGAGVLQRVAQR